MSDKNNLPPGWGDNSELPAGWGESVNADETASFDDSESITDVFTDGFQGVSDMVDDAKSALSGINIPSMPKISAPNMPKIPFPQREQDSTIAESNDASIPVSVETKESEEMRRIFGDIEAPPTPPQSAPPSMTPASAPVARQPVQTETYYAPPKKKSKAGVVALVLVLLVVIGGGGYFGYQYFFGDEDEEDNPVATGGEDMSDETPATTSTTETEELISESADELWKSAYLEIVYEWQKPVSEFGYNANYTNYGLIHIDDNDIPELYISTSMGDGEIYTYKNGETIVLINGMSARVNSLRGYIEREGVAWHYSSGSAFDYRYDIYQLKNGNYTIIETFDYYEYSETSPYTINDVSVSEDEWQNHLNEYFDRGTNIEEAENYSYEEIVALLGGTLETSPISTNTESTQTRQNLSTADLNTLTAFAERVSKKPFALPEFENIENILLEDLFWVFKNINPDITVFNEYNMEIDGFYPSTVESFFKENFNSNFSLGNYEYRNHSNESLGWDSSNNIITFFRVPMGWEETFEFEVIETYQLGDLYYVYATTRTIGWNGGLISSENYLHIFERNSSGGFDILSKQSV